MQVTTTNTDGEVMVSEVPDGLPEGIDGTSGYITTAEYNEEELDAPETLEAVESMITSQIDEASIPKLNRAQRRALAKKAGKEGRGQLDTIGETAKKLNYIDLIQRLRELNNKKENENYEDTTENN